MNNKGQTLVLFVILLPLLFVFIMMVLEVGLLLVDRNKMDSEVRHAVKYALKLDIIDENKVKNVLIDNLGKDIKYNIKTATSDIHIEVNKQHKFLFLRKEHIIVSRYHGYISDESIKIERE